MFLDLWITSEVGNLVLIYLSMSFFKDYFAKATAVIINVHFSITCLLLSYSSHPTTLRIITVTRVGPVWVEASMQHVSAAASVEVCGGVCVWEGKSKAGYFQFFKTPVLVYSISTCRKYRSEVSKHGIERFWHQFLIRSPTKKSSLKWN